MKHIKAKELAESGNAEFGGVADIIEEPTDISDESTGGMVEEPAPIQKERKTSNVVLTILAVFLLAFIVVMIVTFWVKGSVPDTLIQYTMGAGGIEALLLAGIKISKVVTGNKSESDPSDGMG